MYNIEENVRKK